MQRNGGGDGLSVAFTFGNSAEKIFPQKHSTRDSGFVPPPLPADMVEELRQLMDDGGIVAWVIGDYINAAEDEILPVYTAMGARFPRAELIRQLASATGSDESTLRDRASMARFFTPGDRAEYGALSYHQLRACKSAGIDMWRGYADWALEHLPAPVALIRAKIKANGDDEPAWVGRWDRLRVLADRIARDIESPGELAERCREILSWDYPIVSVGG